MSKTYDGNAFGWENLVETYTSDISPKEEGVALGYEKITEVPSGLDVGEYSAKVETENFYLYYESSGERLAESEYAINLVSQPTLTITKCQITFMTPKRTGFYSGSTVSVSCGEATVKSAPSTANIQSLDGNRFSCNNGDIIELTPSCEVYTFDGTGKTTNGSSENPWTAKVMRGDVDVTYNYDISFIYSAIEVCDW